MDRREKRALVRLTTTNGDRPKGVSARTVAVLRGLGRTRVRQGVLIVTNMGGDDAVLFVKQRDGVRGLVRLVSS